MPVDVKRRLNIAENVRFYITALAILIAIFSSFAFLFLVPFVIDPAFSTLFAEYSEVPATCVTSNYEHKQGLSNCTWSSCREGCTREIFECSQIYVNYKIEKLPFLQGKDFIDTYFIDNLKWDHYEGKLFPNVKGCGYPPNVNCTAFDENYSTVGSVFPCYVSKVTPDTVLTTLNLNQAKLNLIYSIGIPWVLFFISMFYLLLTFTGMKKPDPKLDVEQEITPTKASKNASNYSLRSIEKNANGGVDKKYKGESVDDKGTTPSPSLPHQELTINDADRSHRQGLRPEEESRGGDIQERGIVQQPSTHPILPPGNAEKESFRDQAAHTNLTENKDLVLEPSTLQQVHSRRAGTSLPPIEKSSPAVSLSLTERRGKISS